MSNPALPAPTTGPRHARRAPYPEAPRRQGTVRLVPAIATAVAVIGVIAVTLWQLHLPLLFQNSTTTGGDTGAHVMMPRYLESLIAHGHLTGWSPQWYDGYPIYTFYFVLPDLFAAVVGKLIAYNIAFKWATVLGSVALPVALWACARLFRLRRPVPGMLAVAALPLLFDYTYTIYGGNLFSTLAGEYAFSLSLALAMLFLGLFALALRTGRHRGWAAIVLTACILSHIIPAMFALAGALVLTVFELLPRRVAVDDDRPWGGLPGGAGPVWLGRRRAIWVAVSTVTVGLLLSGWWLVPFGIENKYANSMNYQNLRDFGSLLFPEADAWALALAGFAVVLAVVLRSRFGLLFSVLGLASALTLIFDPQGSLYNTRFLPLWFVCVYVMAGWGFAVIVVSAARWWRHEPLGWRRTPPVALEPLPPEPPPPPLPAFTLVPMTAADAWFGASGATRAVAGPATGPPAPASGAPAAGPPPGGPAAADRRRRWGPAAVSGPIVALAAACLVVVPPFFVPANLLPVQVGANLVSNWAQYNYSGYEGKASYPEYRSVMTTMAGVGARHGCGRAMWEYNSDLNRFGTPESLMLLPYFTNGCIDSMEGLLFESSATTPYHFINQAELSVAPSMPMRGLPYGPVDVPLGIQHLQLLGVRYFMAFSPQIQQAALASPSLELVASTGPWKAQYGTEALDTTWDVFLVKDAPLVAPLQNLPAVLRNVGPQQSSWLAPSLAWYDDPADFDVELAQSGPAGWPRVLAGEHPPKVAVAGTVVSGIHQTDQSISFHVSRTGTPVLVKVSYFPNWRATGATGPFRVTPNLMVVVPTSHRVTLVYGSSPANRLGLLATALGALGLVALAAGLALRRSRSDQLG